MIVSQAPSKSFVTRCHGDCVDRVLQVSLGGWLWVTLKETNQASPPARVLRIRARVPRRSDDQGPTSLAIATKGGQTHGAQPSEWTAKARLGETNMETAAMQEVPEKKTHGHDRGSDVLQHCPVQNEEGAAALKYRGKEAKCRRSYCAGAGSEDAKGGEA